MTFFIVDCEATGKSPWSGVMTEFGVVELMSLTHYYGRLHLSVPSDENPAVPVIVPGGLTYDAEAVMFDLTTWLTTFEKPHVFVSDNPAYDYQWINFEYDKHALDNPFGHSARRIGDFAAGLSNNWRNTNRWKKLRRTTHTHHPVDDARGNAEALRQLLGIDS